MSTLVAYLPYLLTALAMTTITAAYAAPKAARKRTASDAFFLNLTTHPLAVTIYVGLPGISFYGMEMVLIVVHAFWYHFITGLDQPRAVRVSVLSGVVGQVLGNLVLLGLHLATR